MKIILLKDTKKIGQKGTVTTVADGYGAFLINCGAAEIATPSKVTASLSKAKAMEKDIQAKNAEIESAIEKLASEPLKITAKANEQGHLFEGITAAKIVSIFKAKSGITIPEHTLELEAPIKEIGEHKVGVSTDTWEGTLALAVIAE